MNYNLLKFCEFDQYAVKSYCAIHNEKEEKNLGDITKVEIDTLPKCDIITHGSPCQDFSIAGSQKGAEEGSGTRSSLIWNSVQIIKQCKPKFVIWENVKNVLSPKHIGNFNKYIDTLSELGYSSYYEVLNACNYGVPQRRERIFCISIRNDINNGFIFPSKTKSGSMKEYLDLGINRKVNESLRPYFEEEYKRDYFSNSGCIKYFDGEAQGIFNSDYTNKRIYSMNGVCPTLTTNGCVNIWEEKGKMTELEMFRLMGFSDVDYNICIKNNVPLSQIHKQAGNSIVVNVALEIFKELKKQYPEEFYNLDMISLFSGIGAFEKALDLLK